MERAPLRQLRPAALTAGRSIGFGGNFNPVRLLPVACAVLLIATSASAAAPRSLEDLRKLSLEDLAEVEITSVSKQPQALSRAAAAVFVITNEDIRRSGATSLPEALRLAPNLNVAQVDAASYAISARGFNTFQASNKLLVLVDGRSIYTPLHGGVFWDQQQVLLEDVDRIEVISGPGGTLWGANAVNGVINIISKPARDTLGGFAGAQLGTVNKSLAARYGGRLGDSGSYRVYGLGFDRGNTRTVAGRDARDDFDGRQAGFRLDWNLARDDFTLQGDIFDHNIQGGSENSGGNLLAHWTRQLGGGSALQVQTYYDRVDRSSLGVTDDLETFDVEAQHSFRLGDRHSLVWGGGYRLTDDTFVNTLNPFVLDPESDDVSIGNIFVQDSVSLSDAVTATLGIKLEYSSYTGLEYLPSARVAWQVADDHLLWASVSRAVRTPSRIDRDLEAPLVLDAASDLKTEKLVAYEAGYRGQPTPETSLSASLFFNDYDDLRILTLSPDTGRLVFGNATKGHTYGLEVWGGVRVTDWWRLDAGVHLLQKELRLETGALEVARDQHWGNDPEYQLSLRSRMNLSETVELDIGVRAIDDLPDPRVPDYVALDARLGWHVTDSLELSIAGFNLLDERHPETGGPANWREIRRNVYAGARWRF